MKSIWKKVATYQIFALAFMVLFIVGGAVKGMWLESLPAWERKVLVLDSAQSMALAAGFSFICAMEYFVRGKRASLYLFEACIICVVADISQLVMWLVLPEDMLQTAYIEGWGVKTAGSVLITGVVVMLVCVFIKLSKDKKGKK